MAFACLREDQRLYSFHYSLEQWIELKTTAKTLNLKMSCCGSPAVMKTSSLGTQFFAHKAKSIEDCGVSEGESKEHLYAKYVVSKTLHDMGWQVEIERTGATPDGETWIADIYAEKGRAKMAVEIQWSPQSYVETRRRQDLYDMSGVRAVWLLKSNNKAGNDALVGDYAWRTKGMPVFTLERSKDGSMWVHDVFHAPTNELVLQEVSVSLDGFIEQLFSGEVEFIKTHSGDRGLSVEIIDKDCWQCEASNKIVKRVARYRKLFGVWQTSPYETIETKELSMSDMEVVNTQLAENHGFKPLEKRRVGGAIKGCATNSCMSCGATLGSANEFAEDYGAAWDESGLAIVSENDGAGMGGHWFLKASDQKMADYLPEPRKGNGTIYPLKETCDESSDTTQYLPASEAESGVHSYEVFGDIPTQPECTVTIGSGNDFEFLMGGIRIGR